jgi:type II secretory pathway predicted ATPase ExeA
MYEAYWQLDRRPFENVSDVRCYYPGESHQGAMLKLRYAVENRRGAALLCGASGSGKTVLVDQLRRHLAKRYRPFVHLVFPQMPTESLLAYLADSLAAPITSAAKPPAAATVASAAPTIKPADADRIASHGIDDTVWRIQQFLMLNAQQDQHAVVAIDEAHLLDDTRTWEALRLLLNFEANSQPTLTLLLVGQPGLLPQLDRMPAMEERLGVKCLLRPFTVDETAAYVNFRLQAAGAKRTIFEPASMETLYELTHGLARQINRLCDLALLVGFAEERQTIGSEQLEAVALELVTVAPE